SPACPPKCVSLILSADRLRVDPRQAFLPPEESQHIENSRRGCLPGECRAKRLCELAQAEPMLFGVGLEIGFERRSCPVLFVAQPRGDRAEQRPRVVAEQRLRLLGQRERTLLEQERGAV